jgi:hypothetical protein
MITKKTEIKYCRNYGALTQITFYFLGLKFWTENHLKYEN